ncbi:YfcC family protein [Roseateles sp.]|uniref:YfcC family protein n=1 Tax=Roseateles sp. TaxID=1971397 RepID=UPI0031D924DC
MIPKTLRLPNTFVLIFSLLVLIAAATWVVPGGRYATTLVDGKPVIDPTRYQVVASQPQGPAAVLMAPIKGFVEAGLIIGFVLIVGGAFSVLQATQAIDALIKAVAKAHHRSALVRALLIPGFVTLFSLGGATFGMAEEAIPFVLIFVPLALALRYDTFIGVAIPFVGSQVGFATAFLNPFNVGVAQGLAGVPLFSGLGYRFVCWVVFTGVTIAFLMWHARRIRQRPESSPCFADDEHKRAALDLEAIASFTGVDGTQRLVLLSFAATLGAMIVGVVHFGWYIEEIAAIFLAMAIVVGLIARMGQDAWVRHFLTGAKDLAGTALIIALAKGTVVLMRDAQIIDAMLHGLAPWVASEHAVFSLHKMYGIQSVINFFIHSGTGQAALTMPVMAPLSDLVQVSRQSAILAFQFGELSTPVIPTSGITVGVLSLARVPFGRWVRWMLPLQLIFVALALTMLAIPSLAPQWVGW